MLMSFIIIDVVSVKLKIINLTDLLICLNIRLTISNSIPTSNLRTIFNGSKLLLSLT